jgi:hypothetical protein
MPRKVHLVGSVPLADAATVFETVGSILGPRIDRIPDGETGERIGWIRWQEKVASGHPDLEKEPTPSVSDTGATRPRHRPRAGVAAAAIEFGPLGYAAAALASYRDFRRLKQAGKVPSGARFLVSLPTPLAFFRNFISEPDQPVLERAYERRMVEELREIAGAVPAGELAIQWDAAFEMIIIDKGTTTWMGESRAAFAGRLIRLGEAVPAGVDLLYHLCYGDIGHKHSIEPTTTANLVDLGNRVAAGIRRPIQLIHMPVPRERDDAPFYEPLKHLRLAPGTQLCLGLIHFTDGVAGTRRRMAVADRYASGYAIATECGFGRRPPETVAPLLRLHAELADG